MNPYLRDEIARRVRARVKPEALDALNREIAKDPEQWRGLVGPPAAIWRHVARRGDEITT